MADRQEIHDSLLKAVYESKEDLLKHINKKTADTQTSLTNITLSEQIQEVETCVGTDKDIYKYFSHVDKVEKQRALLKEKVDDLENHSTRSSVRFLNIL